MGKDQKPLGVGKLPIHVLREKVLGMTGKVSKDLVTPPKAGLDFAAIRVGRRFMVVSADPITGVASQIGEYAIKVSANDVATSGNRPQFAESVVLLPEGSSSDDVELVVGQMDRAAKQLGIAIVGGHTEVSPGLRRPIVSVTAFSFVKEYVSSEDAREGDSIMMTKTAGLEGTAVLATEGTGLRGRIPAATLARARKFMDSMSIVEEAAVAYGTGAVHAMHDCTEGGVLGAVFEMSLASGIGFTLNERAIPVAPETKAICSRYSIDPLRLLGSGSLLMAIEHGKETKVASALAPVCKATIIGHFRKGRRTMTNRDGTERLIRDAPRDELWRVLADSSRRSKRP
ncbi:MAG: AIR synthase-related protein [Thaumarchaeota archaeon]|nr:AIR synthase-related protein [Nitrososphaerota archaeon]